MILQEDSARLASSAGHPPNNDDLARNLELVAGLLRQQGANRFRADAYQRAAEVIRENGSPIWKLYAANGVEGLEKIKGVGRTISRALQQMIRGGRWPLMERLQGEDIVEQTFASVPNIGPKLARRIHEELGIETLAELQSAAWDGRLRRMGGFGEKRIRAVRESLAARAYTGEDSIEFQDKLFDSTDITTEIPVEEILDVDDEYRFKDSRGELPRVAPRRMNPTADAWLPILHTDRMDRHYTALFSNTERAHIMGTTHDWVVIYLEDHNGRGQHGRWTVITSRFGNLRGQRIVRGREQQCLEFYKLRAQ